MKNTGKSLAILSALFSSAIVGIDIYQDKVDFGNIFTSLFSVYICLGAWHIFSDHEKGIQTDILNLYTWPARYFQRFFGLEKP